MQRTKENLQPTNWLQNQKVKSSHSYTDENKTDLISMYPAPLCSSDTGPDRQNQCSNCYLADCGGESPCLLLTVFISALPWSAAEASISKTRIVSFSLLKPKRASTFSWEFSLETVQPQGFPYMTVKHQAHLSALNKFKLIIGPQRATYCFQDISTCGQENGLPTNNTCLMGQL